MSSTEQKTPPLVFVLIDAFRWDYLQPETAPTLWDLHTKGIYVEKLQPSFGYCEITEYATGTRPDVNGKMTQLTCARTRLSALTRGYMWAIDKALRAVKAYGGRGSTRLTNLLSRDCIRPFLADPKLINLSYRIPLGVLPLLTANEATRYTDRNALGLESLYDRLNDIDKNTYDETFVIDNKVKGSDEDRIDKMIEDISDDLDLYMIYLGSCDEFGHFFGPRSEEIKQTVGRIDRMIDKMIKGFKQHNPATRFLLVGDHGMLDVEQTIDIQDMVKQEARKNGLVSERDYVLFLDSTLARLWCNTEKAARVLNPVFDLAEFSEKGAVITPEIAKELQIPPPGDRYGHLIWRADPGVMIFPDYFNPELPKGMHGYPTHIPDQKGMVILVGDGIEPKTVPEGELIDLCPTICDLFDIEYPESNQGTSFL